MKTCALILALALSGLFSACDTMSGSSSHPEQSPTAENGGIKGAPRQPSSSVTR